LYLLSSSACAAMAFASERTFPPLYDWWEDHLWDDEQGIRDTLRHKKDVNGDRELGPRQQHNARKRRSIYQEHRQGIQEGMQITIIIFTMSTRTRVSTGEVRNQMSRRKSIWLDRRIPILGDIIDTERKEIVEGLFK